MPWDALPEHIDEPHEWEGTDWDNWFQKSWLKIKGWFAYGPRSNHWWAKWRETPIPLIMLNCRRLVYTDSSQPDYLATKKHWFPWNSKEWREKKYYPAIIQYWTRWSFGIAWPFHFHFHFYFKKKTIPPHPDSRDFSIFEMVFLRFGARRDQDKVYWFPSLFIGGDFN